MVDKLYTYLTKEDIFSKKKKTKEDINIVTVYSPSHLFVLIIPYIANLHLVIKVVKLL